MEPAHSTLTDDLTEIIENGGGVCKDIVSFLEAGNFFSRYEPRYLILATSILQAYLLDMYGASPEARQATLNLHNQTIKVAGA